MKNVLFVENRYYVTCNNYGFKFYNSIVKTTQIIPFEDVEWLIFVHKYSCFSNEVIQKCLEKDIGMMFCDYRFTPTLLSIGEAKHSERLERLQSQINLTTRTKNRLWKKIVVAKIRNQALVIKNIFGECPTYLTLMEMSKEITDGDIENKEANAASLYFDQLFGKHFIRGRYNDDINACLNYGYAILRAAVKRGLARHGLEMSLGIHHCSTENPYNLADDLIEPFRAMIDEWVYEHLVNAQVVFDYSIRKQLYTFLRHTCIVESDIYAVDDAIEIMINSLIQCIKTNHSADLLLPRIKEFGE